jgi:hypothetical protein
MHSVINCERVFIQIVLTLSKVISLVQDILPILTKNLAVEKTSKLMEVILNVPKHFLIFFECFSNLFSHVCV